VLGPLLFLVYKNDIDDSVCNILLKFADDTKVFSFVSDINDVNKLQDDLKNLCKWSEDWLMLFNVDKCEVYCILGTITAKQNMKWTVNFWKR